MKRALLLLSLLCSCAGAEDGPAEEIPATWKDYRQGEGHLAHLDKDVRCKDCHRSAFEKPSLAVCDNCHENVRDHGHVSAEAPKNDCYACHSFKEVTDVKADACVRCHVPKTHATASCVECHAPHQKPPLAIKGCVKCHEGGSNVHRAKPEIEGCSACHVGHAPAAEATKTCVGCHQNEVEHRSKGHGDCVKCHAPHEKPSTCASCHAGKTTEKHQACSDCHAIHGEETTAAARCQSCHGDVLVDHPQGEASCVGCHQPHQPQRPIKSCNACHQRVPSEPTVHAGKLACASCHRPHAFSAEGAAGCDTCHPKERTALAAGHDECSSCHQAAAHFAKRAPKKCGSCHELQQKTAPKGHDQCLLCHQPHSGATKEGGCASCHSLPPDPHTKSGDCTSCHAPHGPKAKPPGCASCHLEKSGLHQKAAHGECKQCHQPHQAVIDRGRTSCDRCHQLPNHEPAVKTCLGCHPFR